MLASIVKFAAWCLGLMPAAAAAAAPPAVHGVRPGKRRGERRSQPRPSPLAARQGPRAPQPRRIGFPTAAKGPTASAKHRPKGATATAKRSPKPRHVWLEMRAPDSARAVAGLAALLAVPSQAAIPAAA